jgi:hypothetical protein
MSKQAKPKKKRIGRPTKAPKPGERVTLGLRVTPEMKRRLEAAAIQNGRSLSQEAELRLSRSLEFARYLGLARGHFWAPILIANGELLVGLGDDSHGWPQHVVALKINKDDLTRLVNYFGGASWPYEHSNEEIEASGEHWLKMQDEIRRGK